MCSWSSTTSASALLGVAPALLPLTDLISASIIRIGLCNGDSEQHAGCGACHLLVTPDQQVCPFPFTAVKKVTG